MKIYRVVRNSIEVARKINRYDKKNRSLLSEDNIYHTGHHLLDLCCPGHDVPVLEYLHLQGVLYSTVQYSAVLYCTVLHCNPTCWVLVSAW